MSLRAVLVWTGLVVVAAGPVLVAAFSPLLAWRDVVYIVAGFAGVLTLPVLLFQPLLARGDLPGVPVDAGRRAHRWMGALLLALVLVHVGALWLTSPPDVIDALLLRSPTPFSIWGMLAMVAVFAAFGLALSRRRFRSRLRLWRALHLCTAVLIVGGTVVHVLLIDGTMGTVSKIAILVCVLLVLARALGKTRLGLVRG